MKFRVYQGDEAMQMIYLQCEDCILGLSPFYQGKPLILYYPGQTVMDPMEAVVMNSSILRSLEERPLTDREQKLIYSIWGMTMKKTGDIRHLWRGLDILVNHCVPLSSA